MLPVIRRILAEQKGAVVIELALVASMFAVLTVGIVDISNAYSRKLALEQGAQRAIEKVQQTTGDATVEATLVAEACAQVDGLNSDGSCKNTPITPSDITVTWRRECTNAAGTISQAPGSPYSTSADFDDVANACAAGFASEATYIQVTIQDKYTPLFPLHFSGYNSADGAYHFSATAGMRTS
jgi:Flp pilus assembly protein TadG